ncbi:hypothetical protein FRX31_023401, partial [Thalictrum thalictroides]
SDLISKRISTTFSIHLLISLSFNVLLLSISKATHFISLTKIKSIWLLHETSASIEQR